jgi:hypothetical protein
MFAANNFFFVMIFVALLMVVCQLLTTDLLLLWKNHRHITLIAALGIIVGVGWYGDRNTRLQIASRKHGFVVVQDRGDG